MGALDRSRLITATKRSALLLSLALCPVIAAAPSEASTVFTQQACSTTGPIEPCPKLKETTGAQTLRSITFNLSNAADVVATFQAGLYCEAADFGVVDVIGAILDTPDGAPRLNGARTSRHTHLLYAGDKVSFNLATIRVLPYSTGGDKTVYFRVKRLRIDPGVRCTTNNNQFIIKSVNGTP